MFATETEIQYAEKLLLPVGHTFSDNRKEIILNNESTDFHACPGSGKTTTLLAKIIILANRMPLPDGKGICVLTHTNVAIDEIKAHLGEKANILFSYPNFFGTFQTFVHKFFATQALQHFYKSQINRVDDKFAQTKLVNLFGRESAYNNSLHKYLFRRYKNEREIDLNEISTLGNLSDLIRANVICEEGKRKKHYYFCLSGYSEDSLKYHSNLTSAQIDAIIAHKNKLQAILDRKKSDFIYNCEYDFILSQIVYLNNNTKIYISSQKQCEAFLKLKEQLLQKGILTFNDAYQLALRYIKETAIPFKQFISNRFAYLFIDEMQDIDTTQRCLIDNIFDKTKVVIQSFGDSDQAIYNEDTPNNDANGKNSIDDSCRFGNSIANVLQSICVRQYHELSGNSNIPSLKPIMLVYNNPSKVLPEFAKLLKRTKFFTNESIADFAQRERKTDALHRINIKAIGFCSANGATDSNNTQLSINSYFPNFEKKSNRNHSSIKTLVSHLQPLTNTNVKEYTANIINAILAFLDIIGIRNNDRPFSKTSLFAYLRNLDIPRDNELKSHIANWITQIENQQTSTLSEIKTYLTNEFIRYFGITTHPTSPEYQEFMSNTQNETPDKPVNSCIYKDKETEIDIEVATVHSVKGETHIATLYLDTSYHSQTESKRFKENIEGKVREKTGPQNKQVSRVMYVGMSRPKYLLCYAVRKDVYDQFDHEKIKTLWDIVEIDK